MRKLHESENYISINEWLNENLKDDKSIIPHLNTIPNLNSKGIYFGFMKTDGYKELSKFISINPIEPRFTKIIEGVQYDLVYLGTAGTGKKGNSNLAERFEWHINQAHKVGNICHGTLSTLRAGLGALLSDDLIIPDTENLVNSFIKNYMKVYWIEYTDDKLLIDNDEKILIKVLRPLLNIKNNPNAKANAPANSTKFYKIRRAVVYKSTRLRLGCKGESEKIREKNNPNDDTPIYNYQIINDSYEDCVEYFVLQSQHIGEVTRGIAGLPLGKSKITIYDSNNPNFEFIEWKRVTGNNNDYNAQNIYKYFDNTSSSGLRRFIVIQNWMIENDIEDITVKVCSVGIDNLDQTKNDASTKKPLIDKEVKKNEKKIAQIITDQENLILSKNFKIVMMCSKSKKNNSNLRFNNNNIVFKAVTNEIINQYKPDDNITENVNYSWRNFISDNQNHMNIPCRAYDLYSERVYLDLFLNFNKRLYIESAGWGIVNAEFRLPNYDITFSQNNNINTVRNYQLENYNDYNQLTLSQEDDVVFIGTPEYLPLFFELTNELPNRKIIYWKKQSTPINYPIPNDTFIYRYYLTNSRMRWFYELAEKFANGETP